jgi:glycosyltransferase involved in cell wall biosynthesis
MKIIPLAADRSTNTPPQKDKLITIIGRMVPEKGMLEAAQAMARVLPRYPDWQVKFIGARRFEDSNPSVYERQVADALAPIQNQAEMTGFISRPETKRLQNQSAIVLAPSQWQEPAGRVVVEALATGAALITTRRGGIPEYAEGRAVILDRGDADDLTAALEQMLGDAAWRKAWQDKAWADYPFGIADMVSRLDDARAAAMAKVALSGLVADDAS